MDRRRFIQRTAQAGAAIGLTGMPRERVSAAINGPARPRPAQDPTDRSMLTDWLRAHVAKLSSTDPEASLDELEPVRDIVGDARVVALGESCHFVHEL